MRGWSGSAHRWAKPRPQATKGQDPCTAELAEKAEAERLIADLDSSMEEQPLESSEVSLTGIGALWLVLMDYIVTSHVQGLTIAFSVITLVMMVLFRSVKIGLISMVPNLAPVLLALGAMGWFGISLDYTKATIAAIALGISVDDTIHLMTRFHHEFGVHRNYRRALRAALEDPSVSPISPFR